MHPLFTEILAKQHMEQLRCEALAGRNAAGLEAHSRRLEDLEGAAVHWHSLGLLRLYYQVNSDVRKHSEVQHELQMIANHHQPPCGDLLARDYTGSDRGHLPGTACR